MRRARSNYVVMTTVVLSMALVYSQLCAASCAVGACVLAKNAQASSKVQHSSHCHHHSQPASPDNDHRKGEGSSECHSNIDVIAALPHHNSIAAATTHSLDSFVAAMPGMPILYFDSGIEYSNGALPFRSPPKHALISVLRI